VLCHSLSCLLWLHYAAVAPGREGRAARVLLVAPPWPDPMVPALAAFFPVPLDPQAVHAAAGETRVVCADDDPYCPDGAAERYGAPLDLPVEVVPGGGHLNAESGYGPWPAIEAWCLNRVQGASASTSSRIAPG
jgi:predicted alpha/beta hydrolase family esterase